MLQDGRHHNVWRRRWGYAQGHFTTLRHLFCRGWASPEKTILFVLSSIVSVEGGNQKQIVKNTISGKTTSDFYFSRHRTKIVEVTRFKIQILIFQKNIKLSKEKRNILGFYLCSLSFYLNNVFERRGRHLIEDISNIGFNSHIWEFRREDWIKSLFDS